MQINQVHYAINGKELVIVRHTYGEVIVRLGAISKWTLVTTGGIESEKVWTVANEVFVAAHKHGGTQGDIQEVYQALQLFIN